MPVSLWRKQPNNKAWIDFYMAGGIYYIYAVSSKESVDLYQGADGVFRASSAFFEERGFRDFPDWFDRKYVTEQWGICREEEFVEETGYGRKRCCGK